MLRKPADGTGVLQRIIVNFYSISSGAWVSGNWVDAYVVPNVTIAVDKPWIVAGDSSDSELYIVSMTGAAPDGVGRFLCRRSRDKERSVIWAAQPSP